jgi:type II secretory pathway pseudopilin PulG
MRTTRKPSHVSRFTSHVSLGLTLLETLVACGVLAVIITLALQLYVALYKTVEVQRAPLGQLMQARQLTHSFTHDVRNARRTLPSFGSFTAGERTLILELPSATADGLPTAASDVVIYHAGRKGEIVRTVRAGANSARRSRSELIAENISSWQFRVNGSVVRLTVSARETVHRRTAELKLETTASMRNGGKGK